MNENLQSAVSDLSLIRQTMDKYVLGYLIRNSLILYWLEFMAVIAFCTYVLAQAIRHQKN